MEIIGVLLVGLTIGLAAGGAVGWFARQARIPVVPPQESAEVLAARHEAAVAQVRHEEAQARAAVQAELAGALSAVDELRDALEATRRQHEDYVAHHRAAGQERERTESGHAQVLKTLTPVAEQLRAMHRRVEELEQQRSHQHGELAEQLRSTQRSVAESKQAADTLASALSNNSVRGVWGETQLRTLVESAGLVQRVDFELQQSIEADSGARRPDMVIKLPGGKEMAVDAKVPYTAFIDAHRTGIDPHDRQRLLVDHAKKVRRHVDALSSKSYWTGLSASPEFTVAFIPNEQLLSTAMETDPSLMEYAFARGIVLATPTNLWAILKTVAFTWRQEVLTEDAQQVFDLGRELYRRICTMADHAERLRRSLESTVKHYNAFAGSLETRVLVTARRLDQLDESAVIGTPEPIDASPKPLTSGDFAAIADLDRPEIDWQRPEADGRAVVDAEVVEEDLFTDAG
jgi:DNA recombination protein RmuC